MSEAGLVPQSGLRDSIPLQAVHIRAKMVDLVASVVVMQVYKNNSTSSNIEAKYVFPLDEFCTVVGFEAYINGKHIVGEVKEKVAARKEYKKAIEEGHGAYLMEEEKETPNVFSVAVGNLPPQATVLIKITYVTELQVEGSQVKFSLPAAVAPWSIKSLEEMKLQTKLDSVSVNAGNAEDKSVRHKFTFELQADMGSAIKQLTSRTHPQLKIKVCPIS